jgi:hypothetical protein
MKIAPEAYLDLVGTALPERVAIDGYFACPCCHQLTLGEAGGWEICDACGWEDDPAQELHPEIAGGANGMSLLEARSNFQKIGYSCPDRLRRKQPIPFPKES